jgi:hypothetical protein
LAHVFQLSGVTGSIPDGGESAGQRKQNGLTSAGDDVS